MRSKKDQVEKVCSFYVNDWHLTTMILPHIHQKMEENTKVITVLENGISENIKELLNRMNMNKEIEKKILEIDWTSHPKIECAKIVEELKSTKDEKIEILINGDKTYIDLVNVLINKAIKEIVDKKEITIINCYEMTQFNNISQMIQNHEYILNTSGIKRISEVFKKEEKKEA